MRPDYRSRVAARVLRGGGIVAYPTEAVWGLGCDPDNRAALANLLALKRRDPEKGLILVASDIGQFFRLLRGLSPGELATLSSSWPGPQTWLVPHRGRVQPLVHGRFDTVAIRVSAHPVVAALCRAFGGPLVSTSANPQGRKPALEPLQVRRYFTAGIDLLLPGNLGGADRPTAIRHLLSGRVIRPA